MAGFLARLRGRKGAETSDRRLATLFRRALIAVLEGDTNRAETLISEAVRADSEDVEPYRSLARLYAQRGEVGRAIRIHQNLLLRRDLEPAERNIVLAELAGDFRQGGFLKRSVACYQELLAHDARNGPVLEALTELLAELRDYTGALEMARRQERVSRRRDPLREARLWTRFAEVEHADGRSDAARKAVKRALRRDPSNADAHILLGELEAERGKNKAALAAWRAVPEQGGPRAADVHPKLEATFAALGRARDYETFLRGLLNDRPSDAAARMALAATLASRGDVDPAALELRRVIDQHPRALDARIALGRLLLGSGRDADALKQYRELLEWLDGCGAAADPEPGVAVAPARALAREAD
jgi:lipopolysaccharide biosynthesis regulator YciM